MDIKNTVTATNFISKSADRIEFNQKQTQSELKVPQIEDKVSKEALENKVEGMNDFLQPMQTSIKFQLHEQLNVYYVQVIDSSSKEVIKEIPQRKFLDMYASMAELMGLFVDEKL